MLNNHRFRACFQGGKHPREGDGQERGEKDTRLGDLYLAIGDVSDALAYYKSALAATGEDDESRLTVVLKASACLRRQSKVQEALDFVESVMGGFTGRSRRDLLAEKATLLCLGGRYGEAVRVCEEATTQETGRDRENDAHIYLVLGHVLARLCRWQQAIECLEQAAAFGRMCGDLTTRGNALNNLGIVYKNLCRFADSARYLVKAVRIAREQNDDASLGVRLLNLANTLFKTGEIGRAHKAVLECQRIATILNLERTRTQASICKARIDMVRGDLDAARVGIEAAVASAVRLGDPRLELVAAETRGDLLLEEGDLKEARDLLEDCLDRVSPHMKDVDAEIRTRLAAVYLSLGHRKKAADFAEYAASTAESIGDLFEAGRAFRIAAVAGSADSGEHLARAETIFRRIGAELELGRTLHAGARTRRGDGQGVRDCLERAAAIFRRSGARRDLVRTLCRLALAHEDLQEHEKALSCLADAADLGGGNGERRLISETRSRVDRAFSRRFTAGRFGRPGSVDEAVALLGRRFGVEAVVIAREGGAGGARSIRFWGLSGEVAGDLLRFVLARPGSPLVCSNLSDLGQSGGRGFRPGALLALRSGAPSGGYVVIAVWPSDKASSDGGARPHLMVGAFYEISHWLPVFEREVCPISVPDMPLSMAGMITSDLSFKSILFSLPRIAAGSAAVLISGETGTGKELVARAIHSMSPRSGRPFVVQNCAALPEALLESELFGHKAGAFTGARVEKRGLLEAAHEGTFFLDEVGEVSASIQAKLLRATEAGEIRRVGDTISRSIDTRFISATNKNLEEEVEAGSFRRDLYYRLNVVSVNLPPLRERNGDIQLLARFFLERFARKAGKAVKGIGDDTLRVMAAYEWPGNVRQLENEMERLVTMVDPGSAVTAGLLSPCIAGLKVERRPIGLKDEVRMVEKRRILSALKRCGWNKTHAARLLGDVSRPALIAKMKRLGIPLKPD
jgi:transcriptional regulator with AAA-type ATPase domain/tetratricopeptide (TPR) repeat protein